MAKVVYSVFRVNRDEKWTGLGNLSDGKLWTRKKNGKWMVFEDVLRHCHPIPHRPGEYRGYITIAYEDVPVYDKEKNNYKYVDYLEVEYSIWFKYID